MLFTKQTSQHILYSSNCHQWHCMVTALAACAISSLQVIVHLWKGNILRHVWKAKWLEMHNFCNHAFQLRNLPFQYPCTTKARTYRKAWNNQLLLWGLTRLIKHVHGSQIAQKGLFDVIWILQLSILQIKTKEHTKASINQVSWSNRGFVVNIFRVPSEVLFPEKLI